MEELAPTGKLRVAIAVAPAPSALYAIKDEATGKYRGVTWSWDRQSRKSWAFRLSSYRIWRRAKFRIRPTPIDGMSLLCRLTRTKKIRRLRQCLSPVAKHLCCKAPTLWRPARSPRKSRTQRIRRACRPCREYRDFATAPKATFVTVPGVDAAVAAIKAGEIDCIALSRESLSGLTAKIPGSRVLDGGLLHSSTAVAVPKGKMEALAYVSQFIEDAKASGLMRKAFDDMDLKNSQVAPAGMKP
ncbi:MAG TPA: transporter substrate-binding domain-containing protein [Pseudolabrys sp.]|nr:transporter substrate-binding domain-containing protein [Pseudolabrys sp.]